MRGVEVEPLQILSEILAIGFQNPIFEKRKQIIGLILAPKIRKGNQRFETGDHLSTQGATSVPKHVFPSLSRRVKATNREPGPSRIRRLPCNK